MNWLTRGKKAEDAAVENPMAEKFDEQELLDPVMVRALRDFNASVHAWSDAELSRPRVARVTRLSRGRALAGWSLAAALLIATGGGGAYDYHQKELARQAAARIAQEHIAAEKARIEEQKEEELFASMDSAISREVPSAMEPLAALADTNGTNQ